MTKHNGNETTSDEYEHVMLAEFQEVSGVKGVMGVYLTVLKGPPPLTHLVSFVVEKGGESVSFIMPAEHVIGVSDVLRTMLRVAEVDEEAARELITQELHVVNLNEDEEDDE